MKKPRCGAKTRKGEPCKAGALWSERSHRFTRCRNHGGLSTGPKTADGIERIRKAVTKHGQYARTPKSNVTQESVISASIEWLTPLLLRECNAL